MELDKLFTELWHNLYKPFLFYIPKDIVPKGDDTDICNIIILLDDKGFDSELKDQLSNHKMLAKHAVLNGNMFRLIEKSASLKEAQFQFFLEKYMEHVYFVVYVSDWMQRHVEADIKDLREETKAAFQSQATAFLKHLEDLKSKILSPGQTMPKQEVNVLKFIENDLSEIKNALNLNKDSKDKTGTIENENIPIVKKAKKKTPLMTDEAAEAFLLESVFNVRNGQINEE